MKSFAIVWWTVGFLAAGWVSASAGPYQEPGIDSASVALRAWGASIAAYQPAPGAEFNSLPLNALGPRDGWTVSLGDLGQHQLDAGMLSGTIMLQFEDHETQRN